MHIEQKMAALEALYRIEEEFGKRLDTVCRQGCACCCTARVTMTTLEGYRIAAYLQRRGEEERFWQIRKELAANRFVPRTTTNGLVEICLAGEDPPAEAVDGDAGTCPLLEEDRCPLYPVRPLVCRTMRSRTDCAATGYADMDDFSVTVSTVLMQYVEHIDAGGCSGNLADIMGLFSSAANRAVYAEGGLPCTGSGLVNNRPIPALMIPPEHRKRIQPLLEQIARIRV
jgi:Fe-S-cluster containining protein